MSKSVEELRKAVRLSRHTINQAIELHKKKSLKALLAEINDQNPFSDKWKRAIYAEQVEIRMHSRIKEKEKKYKQVELPLVFPANNMELHDENKTKKKEN